MPKKPQPFFFFTTKSIQLFLFTLLSNSSFSIIQNDTAPTIHSQVVIHVNLLLNCLHLFQSRSAETVIPQEAQIP